MRTKIFRHVITALLMSLAVIGIVPTTAVALPIEEATHISTYVATISTDNLDIKSAAIFSDYTVDGDWLLTVELDNTKTPYYGVGTVGRYFTLYLYRTDNTTIIAATPLKFWEDAPVAIYLSPTTVTGLTYGSSYRVSVVGNYATPPSDNYTLIPSDWKGSDPLELDDWILTTAARMNVYFGYTDTDNDLLERVTGIGYLLSNRGGAFFTTAIPNIMAIRPNLFLLPSSQPTITVGTASDTYDATRDWTVRLGTEISDDITSIGALFGISGKEFAGIGVLLLVMAVALIMVFGAGASFGIVIFITPILVIAADMGVTSIIVSIMLGVLCLVLFVRKFWWSAT